MAARWVGLHRSRALKARIAVKRGFGNAIHESVHALGAAGFLLMAAVMNFAMYPDALAAVVSGEREIVSFVPSEPALHAELPARPVDEAEVHLLAATAWAEARSEGEDGMRAVAHVIVNRVGQRFGDNLETVVLAPKQFSAWNIGDPNRPLAQNPERYATGGENLTTWETAKEVAREVLAGQSVDPTDGALFYHTRAIHPYWSHFGEGRRVIGAHVFYRDVPDQPRARRFAASSPGRASPARRGPRAGRVNGVIQYAPAPSETSPPAPTIVSQEMPTGTATTS